MDLNMSEGKFGFTSEESPSERDLALQFQPTPISRKNLAIEEVDRVAEAAGFSSRERGPATAAPRRRRTLAPQPSRHLAIRMPEQLFNRFLRYADKHQLTYNDAIAQLLDAAKEPE
jgi:hypothetical protein